MGLGVFFSQTGSRCVLQCENRSWDAHGSMSISTALGISLAGPPDDEPEWRYFIVGSGIRFRSMSHWFAGLSLCHDRRFRFGQPSGLTVPPRSPPFSTLYFLDRYGHPSPDCCLTSSLPWKNSPGYRWHRLNRCTKCPVHYALPARLQHRAGGN